jgi:hypothetical protein
MPELTERQQEILAAVEQHGGQRAAARALGVHHSTVEGIMRAIRKAGHSPAFCRHEKPEGMHAKKASVYFNADGAPTARWLKYDSDEEDRLKAIEEIVSKLEKRVRASAPVIKKPKRVMSDILTEIPIADHHFRKLAWAPETGEDWDLSIASAALSGGIDSLLGSLAEPGRAVLVNLGDFAHSNNREGTTDRSGNVLDTDSRWDKAVDVMIGAMVSAIDKVAQWTQQLEVINIPGNHDNLTCKWLQRVMSAYYSKTPHVTVRVSPRNREYLEHGNCMLGWYHGDRMNPGKMAQVVAAEEAKAWGRTTFRTMHCGHLHSKRGSTSGQYAPGVAEVPGLVVEHLQSLCANDAWHTEEGWIGQTRAIEAFEWHAVYGPWSRTTRTYAAIKGDI